jgi:Na+/proline symporter
VLDFSFDWSEPYTFWAGLIGGAFLTLGTHGTDQLMVQRYLSARSEHAAARALALSGWIVLVQFALFLVLGVAVACFDDSFSAGTAQPDRAVARFVIDHLPVGVVGLTLAAVFSAAMSTLSSSLNSSATVALNDFYVPWFAANASQHDLLRVGRVLTVFFGLVQIAVGVMGKYMTSHVVGSVLAIAGFTTGVILGVFLLGLLRQQVGSTAALAALCGGLAAMAVIAFATPLAWPWFAVCGSVGTCALGLFWQYLAQWLTKW